MSRQFRIDAPATAGTKLALDATCSCPTTRDGQPTPAVTVSVEDTSNGPRYRETPCKTDSLGDAVDIAQKAIYDARMKEIADEYAAEISSGAHGARGDSVAAKQAREREAESKGGVPTGAMVKR